MNTKSVRFRLTVWYSLSFFTATFVIFSTFYLVTKQALFNQVDSTLVTHGNKVSEVITRGGQDMHEVMAKQAFLSEFSEIPGMLLVVTNDSGKIISNSSNINSQDMIFSKLFDSVKAENKPFFQSLKLEEISMRFYVLPLILNDSFVGSVLIGHPTDVIEKSLANMQALLAAVFAVFILPTIIGGSLLARGATQPISDITSQLKRITSKNLDERVPFPDTGDELEELAKTFNNLLDRLDKAFKGERQFIGDVAHTLKTPLTTQRSTMEIILSKDRTNEEYKKSIKELLVDNNKMSVTLKNILDLAWAQADSVKNQKVKINLSDLLTEIADLARKMSYKKNILIEEKIAAQVFISGKKEKIERAILNIIDNAVKFTNPNGKIRISLGKKNEHAEIKIKDTGIGITKKDLPHIFERFYRGFATVETVGSGLGLAITYGIITVFQGNIKVKSEPGKGTEFTIMFPILRSSS